MARGWVWTIRSTSKGYFIRYAQYHGTIASRVITPLRACHVVWGLVFEDCRLSYSECVPKQNKAYGTQKIAYGTLPKLYMVRVTAAFWEQNAAVTRTKLRAYQAYCTGNLEIRWNSKVRRIFDHLATVQISVFEFQNTREYILLLLLPLKLKGLSGKQLPKRWSLRGMLCSGRSFEMLISLAGEL